MHGGVKAGATRCQRCSAIYFAHGDEVSCGRQMLVRVSSSAMLREHIACPKCGYDLHALPLVRCPECGFRYDAPSLRQLAYDVDWVRVGAARSVTGEATLPLVLSTCFLVIDRSGPTVCGLFFSLIVYLAGFILWARIVGPFSGVTAFPALVVTGTGAAVVLAIVACHVTILLLWLSGAFLLHTWWSRIYEWPLLTPVVDPDRESLRRLSNRWSAIATTMLAIATAVFFGVILAR